MHDPSASQSVDFLEGLDFPAYKIASMEITDTNLIWRGAKTGKPVIISTGMASSNDTRDAIEVTPWRANLAFLHCIFPYLAENLGVGPAVGFPVPHPVAASANRNKHRRDAQITGGNREEACRS